ncbi:hypothetical protein [Streptomyces sp. SM12]|uniref:hypothetical protein n=1 Tax=Streptomyces sp. SM12 TaxID=1071602 RepID=UPI0015E17797|nr:hypothetical protein [Streptomyces sp. SM12]
MRIRTRAALTAATVGAALLAVPACSGEGAMDRFARAAEAEADREAGTAEETDDDAAELVTDEEPDAWALYEAGVRELAEAESVRYTASGLDEGSALHTDIQSDRDGTCVATARTEYDGAVEIRRSGDEVWIAGDQLFWETAGTGALGRLLVGKFLYSTADDPDVAELAALCDAEELLGEISLDELTGDPEVTGRDEHDGVDVFELDVIDDTGELAVILITAEAPHHILRIELPEDPDEIVLGFGDYNVPVDFTRPSADDTLDIAELEAGVDV